MDPTPSKQITLDVKGPERICAGCGLPVIFASKGGMLQVLHKNPACAGFTKYRESPHKLMKYIETGNEDFADAVAVPNRRERRRQEALARKAARAKVPP